MTKRMTALLLTSFGLLMTILMTIAVVNEIVHTDILDSQKSFLALIVVVGVSITPLIAGLHLLVPETNRHPR